MPAPGFRHRVQAVLSWLQRVAAEASDQLDHERGLDRGVVIVGGCVCLCVVGISAGLSYAAVGAVGLAKISISVGVVNALLLFGLRRRHLRIRHAGFLALTGLWFGFGYALYATGGVASPVAYCVLFLPLCGGLFGGMPTALRFGAATFALLALAYIAQAAAWLPPPFMLVGVNSPELHFVMVCSLTMLMLVFAVVQEVVHTNAHSEAVEARRAVELANYSKTCFLNSMSHELRTPLNGVLGLSEVLLDRTEDPETRELVEGIKSSGSELLCLVDDVLDFSALGAGTAPLQGRDFAPAALLDKIGRRFEHQTAGKGLELRCKCVDQMPLLHGDEGRVESALAILVGNAVKFTERGYVAVELRWLPGLLRCEVSDSGQGVPEDKVERIFELFEQVDGSTTRRAGGLGMGLAHLKAIVDMLGGELGVRSVYGSGSCFWFEVEMAPARGETDDAPHLRAVA